MQLKMAKNSLFAILLRKPWWLSIGIAALIGLVAAALLPRDYRAIGALSGLPFIIVGVVAAYRQRLLPSAARVTQTVEAVSAMNWPAFSKLLEPAFERDGFSVQAFKGEAADFELERKGRVMLVSARRWKSARIGIEVLRQLQATRESAEAPDALCIALGDLSDTARAYSIEQRIAVWQGAELAQALRGVKLPDAPAKS